MNDFKEIVEIKSNDELLNMVYQFDEWSPEMLKTVESELTKRNLLPNDIYSRMQEAIEIEDAQLSKGKEASVLGQIVGWLTVFGLLGIYIGYHYTFSKVSSKYTGKRYYIYTESSRKNGSYLFYASLFLSVFIILYKIYSAY